ncbi:aquaporin-11 [Lingula anatina]|uniref:Aquaporin-11 n=1 Tax=Lingula anatina TaxID=7574 RepID=A0A1S3IK37_LINAN|nr:aquaporin-11 [Lingula anatina]|eukprot:XP_013398473.1 aquaporin-11 [Lingula anatina]
MATKQKPVTKNASDLESGTGDYVELMWDYLHDHEDLHNFTTCLISFIVTIIVTRTSKRIVRAALPQSAQEHAIDFIASFQECVYTWEACVLLSFYGDVAFGLALLAAELFDWWTQSEGECNPCGKFALFVNKEQGLGSTLVAMALQMLAGPVSYWFSMGLWSFQLCPTHADRWSKFACASDLTVDIPLGTVIEMACAIASIWLALNALPFLGKLEDPIKVTLNVLLVMICLHFTGGYFNPANASAQGFGCPGNTKLEHIIVYWLGPLMGTVLAVVLTNHFKKTEKKKEE